MLTVSSTRGEPVARGPDVDRRRAFDTRRHVSFRYARYGVTYRLALRERRSVVLANSVRFVRSSLCRTATIGVIGLIGLAPGVEVLVLSGKPDLARFYPGLNHLMLENDFRIRPRA
jgi:hypothetical protein